MVRRLSCCRWRSLSALQRSLEREGEREGGEEERRGGGGRGGGEEGRRGGGEEGRRGGGEEERRGERREGRYHSCSPFPSVPLVPSSDAGSLTLRWSTSAVPQSSRYQTPRSL